MFRGKVKHMPVAGIVQKGAALRSCVEPLGLKGHLAPPGHQAADVQTPVGVQVVHHPVIPLHAREAVIGLVEMGHEVSGLPGGPNGPGKLAGGHGQSIDQHPRAVADVLMLASLATACLGGFGGGFALKDLPAGFFITADDQTALLGERQCRGVQLANGVGFGIKVLIVAVEPILALMGLEIDLVQDTPDA